jgi:hypothetical protein
MNPKLAAVANKYNLKFDLDAFAADWKANVAELDMMKKYGVSGEQMRALVIEGGLGARFPGNDPREPAKATERNRSIYQPDSAAAGE